MIVHGESGTRLNNIWYGMKARCYNPNHEEYQHYGGKGVIVCEDWRTSYINFRDWALQNGYSDELTLDRKEMNGNYEPSNCKWSTYKQQMNNKTNNVFVEYNGELFTVSELADYAHMSINTMWVRLNRLGWSVEKAVNTPVRKLTKYKQ